MPGLASIGIVEIAALLVLVGLAIYLFLRAQASLPLWAMIVLVIVLSPLVAGMFTVLLSLALSIFAGR